jgi:hypothetical protein
VAFAFDRSDEFGHDKAADHACRHLDAGYRCRIHKNLVEHGYAGCVRFDCLGAGQRVTQEVFGGGDWQKDPELLAPMSAAFRTMRRIHDLLQLLLTADSLALDAGAERRRRNLIDALDPKEGWTAQTLAGVDTGQLADDVEAFLQSLPAQMTSG